MGHQESDFRPFSSFAEYPAARIDAGMKAGGQYSRESVPVTGGKRTYGVPLDQLVILGHSGVPRVVARLCHFIERHGMQTQGLFSTPGHSRSDQRTMVRMRADFDMYGDSNLERYKDVAAAAGCLKMFLRELPEAVVPSQATADFVATLHDECSLSGRCERLSTLVHSLPPPHYALLRFLCSFLKRVTSFHCAHMSSETLGVVFGPNVFRLAEGEGGAPCLRQQAATNRILAQLIHNYDRIFNVIGQRHRPGSDRSDRPDRPNSADTTSANDQGEESDTSAPTGVIKQRVDKSIQAAVTSHLLATVTSCDDEAGDRSGEPPCKRLEAERSGGGRGFRHSRASRHSAGRASYQPWPAGRQADCVRRASSHDDVRDWAAAGPAPPQGASRSTVARSRSAHQVAAETEPITVPCTASLSYDLPTPWSPVYTDEVVESSSTSSSSSECGDTPPALQEIMCRHEQQRESERLATFPRARDKPSRSRDVRRRRHSRGDGKESVASCSTSEGDEDDDDDEEELSDSDAIPPLDLDCTGSDPISSTVLKGRQLTDDEVILSPRNSFILPDDEFAAEQLKLCSRFNERPPSSPGSCPTEPLSHQLRHTIASAKKRVRGYEERFEARHGYRPSHADRQKDRDMKRCLSELSRARRQLKQLKQEAAVGVAADVPPQPQPQPAHRQKENRTPPTDAGDPGQQSLQQTVSDVMKRLCEKRQSAGRPTSPDAMSREQVLAEKLALQKALLCLEDRHGRPAEKVDRDMVRPLYERYRVVKRLVAKGGSPKLRDSIGELTPIMEHETMTFTVADRPAISGRDDEAEASERAAAGATDRLQLDDNLHNLPLSQLREQLIQTRDDKRRLRSVLLVFEENFRSNVGRKVQKDDRGDMDEQYAEYKQVKAKVKLLEVLVAKHRSRSYTM